MNIDNYVFGGVVAATAVVSGGVVWLVMKSKKEVIFATKPDKKPDLSAFKHSMEERYKHPESMKIDEELRKEILKGVHYNIANDITHLFSGEYHAELNVYNEKLYSKYQ